ncbi:MAG: hypothetical protein IKS55_15070 [Oscillospiraceae bacterium]|nr:hypothetical protein [Oscillospiraceae bacterium]
MKCECCGRETEVLIEIGAVSPKVSITGKCCADCCAFILTALEDGREDPPVRQAEIIPAEEDRLFVDEDGEKIGKDEIRFGMKDAGGRVHYFCIRRFDQIPEYEAVEIYLADQFSRADRNRTSYCFRSFGHGTPDEYLLMDVIEKLETALLNPVIREEERGVPSCGFFGKQRDLRDRGWAEIESRNGEIGFRVDGKLYSAQEFADMLSSFEGFRMNWQVQDALTEISDRDTYWLPVRITDELLLNELELIIFSASGNRDFISYKDMNAFDLGFDALYEKLKLYYRCNPPGIGKVAGMKLIHRLEELETDDDTFPQYQIETIRDLIGEF